MIKAADIFGSRNLDFIDRGPVDVVDLFNNAIAAPLNQILPDYEDDPFIAAADAEASELEGEIDAFASSLAATPANSLGFERSSQVLTPAAAPDRSPRVDGHERRGLRTPQRESVASATAGEGAADFTFQREARRDSQGNLRVYRPPEGDGGGSYEIAGITARYQPKEAARLKRLIESGNTAQAEREAKEFFRKRAEPFVSKTDDRGLQLQISDAVHHRGEGGLRRILQRATGSDSKSHAQLIRALDARPDALARFDKARRDYEWQEVDRGRASRRKFREGLSNRFSQANAAALAANRS